MNCIGKYRRNLINMDETLTYFYFEKWVFLVELIFMSNSTRWEEAMGAEAIFWIYNSIVFAQSVIQTMLQCLILSYSIGEVDGKNDKEESRFYVSRVTKVLEPRRSEYLVGEERVGGGGSPRLRGRKITVGKSQTKKGKSTVGKSTAKKGRSTRTHQQGGTSRVPGNTLPSIEEIDRRLVY